MNIRIPSTKFTRDSKKPTRGFHSPGCLLNRIPNKLSRPEKNPINAQINNVPPMTISTT